jgi:hypothetical protein
MNEHMSQQEGWNDRRLLDEGFPHHLVGLISTLETWITRRFLGSRSSLPSLAGDPQPPTALSPGMDQ